MGGSCSSDQARLGAEDRQADMGCSLDSSGGWGCTMPCCEQDSPCVWGGSSPERACSTAQLQEAPGAAAASLSRYFPLAAKAGCPSAPTSHTRQARTRSRQLARAACAPERRRLAAATLPPADCGRMPQHTTARPHTMCWGCPHMVLCLCDGQGRSPPSRTSQNRVCSGCSSVLAATCEALGASPQPGRSRELLLRAEPGAAPANLGTAMCPALSADHGIFSTRPAQTPTSQAVALPPTPIAC